ncbi:MAG: hypothetical protein AAF429_00205 [Pseudomonadota bacterium]
MTEKAKFIIYSDEGQSDPFIKLLITTFREMEFDVTRKPNTWQHWKKAKEQELPCLFIGKPAPHAGALCAFRILSSNNWVIDRATKAVETEIGSAEFTPINDDGKSKQFLRNLRKRNSEPQEYEFALTDFALVVLDDFLAPIGGRETNSFKIIREVQKFTEERHIVIHAPMETYNEKKRDQLRALDKENWINFSTAPLDRLLPACAFVVTQDGAITLRAALHEKPCLIYGDEAFHHLARSTAKDMRLKKSFNRLDRDRPDYPGYMKWVLDQSIDMRSDDAAQLFVKRLQELNWPN